MIFLRAINPVSAKLLERIYRSSKHHQVRQRAQCLILALQGVKVEELIKTFQVSCKTVYNWFERWESEVMVGLYNQKGQGRKPRGSARKTVTRCGIGGSRSGVIEENRAN